MRLTTVTVTIWDISEIPQSRNNNLRQLIKTTTAGKNNCYHVIHSAMTRSIGAHTHTYLRVELNNAPLHLLQIAHLVHLYDILLL